MANVVSDFRKALIAHLADSFPDVEVRSGRRAGVSRDRDRIHVFFDRWEVDQARVVVGRPIMLVRYWKARSEVPPSDWPVDPEELEQASIDLLAALRTAQELPTLIRPWYFQVSYVRVDDDPEEWGVEAQLVGYTANLGTIA